MARYFLNGTRYVEWERMMQKIPREGKVNCREQRIEEEAQTLIYVNEEHKKHFQKGTAKLTEWLPGIPNSLTATLFLLSADPILWGRVEAHINEDGVDIDKVSLSGISPDGYTLYHVAKDLCWGTGHIKLSELMDSELVEDKLFTIILCAILMCRRPQESGFARGEVCPYAELR